MFAEFDEKKLNMQVCLDILTAPITLIPTAIGITFLLSSWVLSTESLNPIFLSSGVVITLASICASISRLIYNKEDAFKKAFAKMESNAYKLRQAQLDTLYRDLKTDRDNRTDTALSDMRILFDGFYEDVRNGKIHPRYNILDRIKALFEETVKMLILSLELKDQAAKIKSRKTKEVILERREKVIQLVEKSVSQITTAIDEVRRIAATSSTRDLEKAYDSLEETLEFSKEVDKELESMYNNSEYEMFRKFVPEGEQA